MIINPTNDGIVPPWLQPIDLWPLPTDPNYPHNHDVPTLDTFIPDDEYDGFDKEL